MMKKIRKNSGFTLAEMLIALALLGVFGTAAIIGLVVANNTYYHSTAQGESGILASTIAVIAMDELKFAQDIDPETLTFTSEKFGADVAFSARDGRIYLGEYKILSDAAYPEQLTATLDYTYDDGVFYVTIRVFDVQNTQLQDVKLSVLALNGE